MHSAHFSEAELACRCGCGGQKVDSRLLDALETLREKCGGLPIEVTSAYRCPEHNRRIGGAPQSQHLLGRAADIRSKSKSVRQLLEVAMRIPLFAGLGVDEHRGFLHVDVRAGDRAMWCYDEHGTVVPVDLKQRSGT